MRLIDVDKIKQNVTNEMLKAELNSPVYCTLECVIADIDNQPTAYDVDKVVERLEEMRLKREDQLRTCADNDMADYFRCKMSAIAEVIEIVKSGGIE